jgi:hypothetical protein
MATTLATPAIRATIISARAVAHSFVGADGFKWIAFNIVVSFTRCQIGVRVTGTSDNLSPR